MVTLYAWPTPNAHKVSIMLEECALDYKVVSVDITAGDQFKSEFLVISPNNRMPALVDDQGPEGGTISIFESGAILIYLADKVCRLMPAGGNARYDVLQWLMFQMGNLGPICGQAHHFREAAPERVPYAINRFTNEAERLYHVMDKRLEEIDYLAGKEYSIADIATWPWIARFKRHKISLEDYPNVLKWYKIIMKRPPVIRGYNAIGKKEEIPFK